MSSVSGKAINLLQFAHRSPNQLNLLSDQKEKMPRKGLVIRFSSIGDIVLTSPVVRCLHQIQGGVEIHFLTKERFASLAENNPYIYRTTIYRQWQNTFINIRYTTRTHYKMEFCI